MKELEALREDVENRAADLEMVAEISRTANARFDLREVCRHIVARVQERLGFHPVIIFIVDTRNGDVVNFESTLPELEPGAMRVPQGLGLIGSAAETKETVRSEDVLNDPRYLGRVGIAAYDGAVGETRAEIAIPLLFEGELLGVLDAQGSVVIGLSERVQLVVQAVANETAGAIFTAWQLVAQEEIAWISTAQYQVARTINDHRSLDSLVQSLARIVGILLGSAQCGVLTWDYSAKQYVPKALYAPSQAISERFMAQHYALDDWSPLGAVHLGQVPRTVTLASPWLNEEQTYTLMPLQVEPHWVGIMFVGTQPNSLKFYPAQHERRWRLQENIALQMAQAIDREQLRLIGRAEAAERWKLQREVELALGIQTSLIPEAPAIPGLDVAAHWEAARQVSGDFYDFLQLAHGNWGIVIADVAGKGVPAALFMALSRTIVRAVAFSRNSPAETLWRANEVILNDTRSNMFVTVFYALWQPEQQTLTWANGGHPPPLLVRNGEITPLQGRDVALGVVSGITYQPHVAVLQPDDLVLFYTDGVTEAHDDQYQLFGVERLESVLRAAGNGSPQGVIDAVMAAIGSFAGGGESADDVTMVVLKVRND